MSNFYCVPLRMFTEDTKQVFKKAKNKIVKDCPVSYQNKVTLWESFVMKLCVLWELEAADDIYNVFCKDSVGVYFSKSCIDAVFGKIFFAYYNELSQSKYSFKVGMKRKWYTKENRLVPAYYFNIKKSKSIRLTVIRQGTREYDLIQYYLDKVKSYFTDEISEYSGVLDLYDNVKVGGSVEYGDFFSNCDSVVISDAYKKALNDLNIKRNIVFFNLDSTCIVKCGKVYSFLDFIPKSEDVLYSDAGEKLIQYYDMRNAFILGLFSMCSCYAEGIDMKEIADVFSNYINTHLDNPYEFVDRGELKGCSADIKNSIISYANSVYDDIAYNDFFIRTVLNLDIFKETFQYCKEFLKFVEENPKADKDEVGASENVYYALTLAHTDKLKFYLDSPSFTTIRGNKKARTEITSHGKTNLSIYIKTVSDAYNTMLQYHAEESLDSYFGKDVRKVFHTVISLLNYVYKKDSLRSIKTELFDMGIEKDKIVSDKQLAIDNVPSFSSVCQFAETMTLVNMIIPELKVATGNKSIIPFNDYIYCSESVAKFIDKKKLNTHICNLFIENIMDIFKDIYSYYPIIFSETYD